MITLLRWYLLKAKQIKIKLLFYSITEQVIKEFISQNKDWEQKIVHELAQITHNSNDEDTNEDDDTEKDNYLK